MRVAAGRGTHSLRYPVPKYVNSQHLAWQSLLTLIKPRVQQFPPIMSTGRDKANTGRVFREEGDRVEGDESGLLFDMLRAGSWVVGSFATVA